MKFVLSVNQHTTACVYTSWRNIHCKSFLLMFLRICIPYYQHPKKKTKKNTLVPIFFTLWVWHGIWMEFYNHSLEKQSHVVVFCEKDLFKNSAKFTGKHMYRSLFVNKFGDSGTCVFLWILRNFKKHLLCEISAPMVASVYTQHSTLCL